MFKIYYILTFPLTFLAICLIMIYRLIIRKFLGKSCKFVPTCSSYGLDSIIQFGFFIGGYLTLKRLLKCRPSSPAGIDYPKLNLQGNYKWKC